MPGKPDRHALDAAVILRYLLDDNETLSPLAAATMRSVEAGKLTAVVDPVTLSEVVVVLSSYYKLARQEVAHGLLPLIKNPGVSVAGKGRYVRALELYASTVAHWGDACACAAALEECDGRLISFDRKLSDVEGVTRAEPTDTA